MAASKQSCRLSAQSLLCTVHADWPHARRGDRVFELEIRGTLAKADLDRVQARLVDEMRAGGPVRLLFVLDQFDGWDRDDWHDLTST